MGMIRAIIDLDLDTGEYEIQFKNLDDFGGFIDYHKIAPVLRKVFADADKRITGGQAPEPDSVDPFRQ